MKQFNEKGYALFKEIGNIDDSAVVRAADCPTQNKVKSGFWGWIAIAACLAVMTGVLMFVKPAKNITPGTTSTETPGTPGFDPPATRITVEESRIPETEPPISADVLARYGEGRKLLIAIPSDVDMALFDAEETGHLVSRALCVSRNELAEKTGLKIKTVAISDGAGFYSAVRRAYHAGETDCDVYEITARDMVLLASDGALMPFGLSYDGQPGCDLTQPYWNQAVPRDLLLGGLTYVMSSAADLSVNASTACVAFNESLAEELGLDLYAEAKNGNWDTEMLLTLMKQGNLLSGNPQAAEYLYFGMGGQLCDPDGTAYPTPCFDSPDFDGFFDKVLLLTEHDSFRRLNSSAMPLFTVTTLGKGTMIKGLGGILPMPTTGKSEYRSPVDLNTARFYGVTYREEFEAAFAFDALALAASEAYGKLSGDYIDAITIASVEKENAKAMVGIILANQRMDPCLAGTDLYFDDVLRNRAAAFTEVQAAWDMESTKTEEAKRLSDWAASK